MSLNFDWDTIQDHFFFLNDFLFRLNVEIADKDILGKYDYEMIEIYYQHNFRLFKQMALSLKTRAGVFADYPPSFIWYGYDKFLTAVPPGDRDDKGKRFISVAPKISFPIKDRLWISIAKLLYLKRAFLNFFWEGGVLEMSSVDIDTLSSLRHDFGPEIQFDCDIFGVAPGILILGTAIPARETKIENCAFFISLNGQF